MARLKICVAGLGNPGPRYRGTRHNIGFDWLEAAVAQISPRASWTSKYNSEYCPFEFSAPGGETYEIHALKPQTFMNESGKALADWKSKNQGESRLLIVYDDMDLPLGRLRYRSEGSDGGHRGLRSVIERLGSPQIPRLRLGIGRPSVQAERQETLDHVLEKFSPPEKLVVQKLLETAGDQLQTWLTLEKEIAMNRLNSMKFGENP